MHNIHMSLAVRVESLYSLCICAYAYAYYTAAHRADSPLHKLAALLATDARRSVRRYAYCEALRTLDQKPSRWTLNSSFYEFNHMHIRFGHGQTIQL